MRHIPVQILGVEAGPGGHCHRCIHGKLVYIQIYVCVPTFQPDLSGTPEIPPGQSCGDDHSPQLAYTELVCVTDEDAGGQTNVPQPSQTPTDPAEQTRSASQPPPDALSTGMYYLRRSLHIKGILGDAAELCIKGWRESTVRQYAPFLRQWEQYCQELAEDPFSPSQAAVVNFLSKLYRENKGYSSINTARSAISAISVLPNGQSVGSLPEVKRCVRGVFNQKPSLPRYSETWDVKLMLNYLRNLCLKKLDFKTLSKKLTILLLLFSGQRVSTIQKFKIKNVSLTASKCVIRIDSLLKTSRPGKHLSCVQFSKFEKDSSLCILSHMGVYLDMKHPCGSVGKLRLKK